MHSLICYAHPPPPAEQELEVEVAVVRDASLRHTLQFGIGLHHAGLPDSDRELVERLYVGGKIQVGWRYRWQYRWQYRWRYKWCPCCRRRLLLPYGPLPPFSFQFTWSTC